MLIEIAHHSGGTSKAAPMTVVLPDRSRTDELFRELIEGLNGPFVADLLSQMSTHERCGCHLYRTCAARTRNPVLRSKFEELGAETERHVEVLDRLVGELGGDPAYVSPAARATEKLDAALLEATYLATGSSDPMTQELAMVEAVMHAEVSDLANWRTLAKLAEKLPAGPQREAVQRSVGEVLPQEDEHLSWASDMRERMLLLQADPSFMASIGEKAERLVERIKGLFS